MNTVTTASSTFLPPLEPSIQKEFQRNSLQFSTNFFIFFNMTTLHSGDIDCPIAPLLSIPSARLPSRILKKHLTTLNAQLKTNQKADPHLTGMILLNMFQIFQITRINFDQYLQIHKHLIHIRPNETPLPKQSTLPSSPNIFPEIYLKECVLKWKNKT